MKVAVASKRNLPELSRLVADAGFEVVKWNPDVVIVVGGDGSILYSERLYPSVPKLVFKTSKPNHSYEYSPDLLERHVAKLRRGEFAVREEMKLSATYRNHRLTALNEIQVHNLHPTRALRFQLQLGERMLGDLVGDGVIVATPFGATAYYSAAGGVPFERGIGVCLNNPYRLAGGRSFTLAEDVKITVTIRREKALLIADNDDESVLQMAEGESVTIAKSEEAARFIEIST